MTMKKSDFSGIKLIMLAGKGGVGKTTCSAALAFQFARLGEKTLLVSSDPTPSLSDIFEMDVGPVEKKIQGVPNLFGLEIHSQIIRRRWKERFGPEIYEVLSAFSNLDYDFVDYIGSAPGIEEEYMLSYMMELVESGGYERVIWDTAPAGHTLRLLHLPQLFLNHLEAAAKFYLNLYDAFDKIAQTARLKKSKRTILQIIAGWQELSRKVLDFLRDRQRTTFILVTIAESLGVRLTERVFEDLREFHLSVPHLIINNLIQEADCPFHRRRQAMQRQYVKLLREAYSPSMSLIEVPLLPEEVRGLQGIQQVAGILFPDP
jgi:arsenite/tail-anchored protein-transporting ATPase